MMAANNGTYTDPTVQEYTKAAEFAAFDALPSPIRAVIQEAPFDVSAADMQSNHLVMGRLRELGEDAPEWLADALSKTYRDKILKIALGDMLPPHKTAISA